MKWKRKENRNERGKLKVNFDWLKGFHLCTDLKRVGAIKSSSRQVVHNSSGAKLDARGGRWVARS